jgi:tetratricopeptide (TPR) repeat protein
MARSSRRKRNRRRDTGAHVEASPAVAPRPRAPVGSAISQTDLALGVVIVVATILAYLPAIQGGFIWDDNMYVTANELLWKPGGLGRIWFEPEATPQYYPLVHTTYWLEYRLWGLAPVGYHLVNVLLHAASALVLWRLLRTLAVPGAWLAAAVFALHPVQVESVAWVTERKNVLSCLLYLIAWRTYLPFALAADGEQRAWGRWSATLALYVAALLSKTVVMTFPFAVLVVVWWKRGRIAWRDVAPLVPLMVIGVSLGYLTAWLEAHHVGASGKEWSLTLLDRCVLAGRVVWFYAAKLVWPHPLVFVYPRWHVDATVWWQSVYTLALLAVVAALWLARDRLGRGPLAAVLVFAGTLAPALGFVDVFPFRYSFVADHFQYHASMALIVLACAVVASQRWPAVAARVAAAGLLLVLGATTWVHAHVYADLETLYRDTLAKNTDAWLVHNNLGRILEHQGKIAEARDHFAETIRLFPEYPEGHNNLGAMLEKLGKPDEALAEYRESVRLLPDFADATMNLGRLLAQRGQHEEAIGYLEASVKARPFAPAMRNLARSLAAVGRTDDAIARFRDAIRLDPGNAQAHVELGGLLEQRGRNNEAIDEYATALRMSPGLAAARDRLNALRAGGAGH